MSSDESAGSMEPGRFFVVFAPRVVAGTAEFKPRRDSPFMEG
jgi:hypothetical protein